MRASKPDNRNYLAIDSDPAAGISTQETFHTHIYLTTGVNTRPLAKGICYEWSVPNQASMHYAWIAAGAYLQVSEDIGDQWFVQGRLNFFRGGRPVGEFVFGDVCNTFGTILQGKANRLLSRTRGDASGSYQPTMRYQAIMDSTYARDNLDIACFALPVRCDKIQYEIESFYVAAVTGSIQLLTGARIVSLP